MHHEKSMKVMNPHWKNCRILLKIEENVLCFLICNDTKLLKILVLQFTFISNCLANFYISLSKRSKKGLKHINKKNNKIIFTKV